jgi:hypothetical protein
MTHKRTGGPPMPARYLVDDDVDTQMYEFVEAMESLAEALTRYADRIRKQWPHGLISRRIV